MYLGFTLLQIETDIPSVYYAEMERDLQHLKNVGIDLKTLTFVEGAPSEEITKFALGHYKLVSTMDRTIVWNQRWLFKRSDLVKLGEEGVIKKEK